jgi:protein TonB
MHAALVVVLPKAFAHAKPPRPESAPLQVVEIAVPSAPPPPAAPETPAPEKAATHPRAPAPRTTAAAPPRVARAAAVLTRSAAPDEPVDMSDSIVTGSAAVASSGATSAVGTNGEHGPWAAAPAPAPSARGTSAAPARVGPDRSRRASVLGGSAWKCPFPSEADRDGIDRAVATIRVATDARGAVANAAIVQDPGHGFGREARQCALNKRFEPALDHDGTPVEGVVSIHVRFER